MKYITAEKSIKLNPNDECCDCVLEAADAIEESIWIIWYNRCIY